MAGNGKRDLAAGIAGKVRAAPFKPDATEGTLLITMRAGRVEVRHGETDELLLRLNNARPGTWAGIWGFLQAIGFQRETH